MSFRSRLLSSAGGLVLFPRSLSGRIVVSVSVILAAALAVHSGITASRQSRALLREMRGNTAAMGRALADSMVGSMMTADHAEIKRLVLQAAEFPRFEHIQVCEPNGRVLADVTRYPGSPPRIRTDSPPLVPPARTRSEVVTEEEHSLVIWVPIRAGTNVGWVRTVSSTREIASARVAVWRNSLLLAVILIAGSSGLLVLLLRLPLRSVRDLAAFARGLAVQRGGQISVPRGPVEIEQLEEALNYASRELASAERQVVAERERLAVTLNSIVDGVIATDTSGAIVLMNRVAEELTGWRAAEAQGKRLTEVFRVIDGESRLPLVSPVQAVIAGMQGMTPVHAVLVTRDRGERIIAESVAPIIDRRGDTVGVVLVFNDVTDRKRQDTERRQLEEQLRQSQKMDAVGRLTGGIAHDFNNVLSAIIGYANILRLKISTTDPLRAYVDRIIEASNRASNLTSSLLSFSRQQAAALQQQDLNGIVRGFSGMLRRLIREDIVFQLDLCAGPALVMADKGQIEQVLINLVTNARDAMPGGGRIRIATGVIASGEQEGPAAVLTISDTGVGMDQEILDRLFEQLPTTKEGEKGAGPGLALVAEIIRKHGGTITAQKEPERGTTFRILLPTVEASAETAPAEQLSYPPVGRETILLVEDDQAVRMVAKASLEEYGYRVLEAGTADEAVGICRNRAEAIQLLITDVILPGKDGKSLSDEIIRMRPDIRILFMSGYPEDIMAEKGLDARTFQFIPKPIDFERLLQAVRSALTT